MIFRGRLRSASRPRGVPAHPVPGSCIICLHSNSNLLPLAATASCRNYNLNGYKLLSLIQMHPASVLHARLLMVTSKGLCCIVGRAKRMLIEAASGASLSRARHASTRRGPRAPKRATRHKRRQLTPAIVGSLCITPPSVVENILFVLCWDLVRITCNY